MLQLLRLIPPQKWAAQTLNVPYPVCRTAYKELDTTVVPLLKKAFRENRASEEEEHRGAWVAEQERLDREWATNLASDTGSSCELTKTKADLSDNITRVNTDGNSVTEMIRTIDTIKGLVDEGELIVSPTATNPVLQSIKGELNASEVNIPSEELG